MEHTIVKEKHQPTFYACYYVDEHYSQNHAHMLHKHKKALELLYIHKGTGRYLVGKREYAIKPGDIVICNAGVIHGEAPLIERNTQTYCCALKNVKRDKLPPGYLLDNEHKPVLSLGIHAECIGEMMKTLYLLASKKEDNQQVCQDLAIAIYSLILSEAEQYKGSIEEQKEQKREKFVRDVTEYLDQNYTTPITLKAISEVFYTSPSTLSHTFKKETGLSPVQYIIHRRIGEAQSLLSETTIPIKTIEESLGFGSSCHFSAMFKKHVGISPNEYRKHFTKDLREL